MSLEYAARAFKVFLDAIEEAQAMGRAGNVGAELDDVLRHASEMLDVVDDELSDVDRVTHAEMFAAAPVLRQKLERLRDELRGGKAHYRIHVHPFGDGYARPDGWICGR